MKNDDDTKSPNNKKKHVCQMLFHKVESDLKRNTVLKSFKDQIIYFLGLISVKASSMFLPLAGAIMEHFLDRDIHSIK